ncbi:hypothetical protein I6D99_16325, partial [Staphylococcus aureus]|nr:hypothetical protein [Staphylococcus aureus]
WLVPFTVIAYGTWTLEYPWCNELDDLSNGLAAADASLLLNFASILL